MTLEQILKQLKNKEYPIIFLNSEEKETLITYITQLEKVIDMELKWI